MKARSVIILAMVVTLGVVGVYFAQKIAEKYYVFNGSIIEPPMESYDIALVDGDGFEFRLSEQKGKVVLIFFGYTSCPDFCPTTLYEYNRVYEELGDLVNEVEFVFISVDPERDTPKKAATYARAFNLNFIGLSGLAEELAPIYKAFYVVAEISDEDTAAGYIVNHSTRTIVIDKNGDFRMTFPYGVGAEAMIADIRHLISE